MPVNPSHWLPCILWKQHSGWIFLEGYHGDSDSIAPSIRSEEADRLVAIGSWIDVTDVFIDEGL